MDRFKLIILWWWCVCVHVSFYTFYKYNKIYQILTSLRVYTIKLSSMCTPKRIQITMIG